MECRRRRGGQPSGSPLTAVHDYTVCWSKFCSGTYGGDAGEAEGNIELHLIAFQTVVSYEASRARLAADRDLSVQRATYYQFLKVGRVTTRMPVADL